MNYCDQAEMEKAIIEYQKTKDVNVFSYLIYPKLLKIVEEVIKKYDYKVATYSSSTLALVIVGEMYLPDEKNYKSIIEKYKVGGNVLNYFTKCARNLIIDNIRQSTAKLKNKFESLDEQIEYNPNFDIEDKTHKTWKL
jgi:hypothetical protein